MKIAVFVTFSTVIIQSLASIVRDAIFIDVYIVFRPKIDLEKIIVVVVKGINTSSLTRLKNVPNVLKIYLNMDLSVLTVKNQFAHSVLQICVEEYDDDL